MNARAERLLSTHANLQLSRYKRVSAKAVDEATTLESCVRQSIFTNTPAAPVIIRNEFGPNTLIFVQPIEGEPDAPEYLSHFLQTPTNCLLMVFDPTDFSDVPDKMISHLLNLTPKETEVVKALTNGASARDAAEQLGISYNTARNHIANVSRRLEVGSQTEIVRLVMTTLSRFRAADTLSLGISRSPLSQTFLFHALHISKKQITRIFFSIYIMELPPNFRNSCFFCKRLVQLHQVTS